MHSAGDVKIFDFGLAREFDRAQQDDSGCYKMTGDTGSPRYMAPEIALNTSYNENVDVYSFCILFWQILRLETPFEGCTMSTFHKRVVVDGLRPTCDPKWPRAISSMIESGWADYSQRPPMADVAVTIRDEISAHSDQSQLDMLDISRKSDASFRAANESKDNPSTGLVRGEHGKSLASFRKLNLNEK